MQPLLWLLKYNDMSRFFLMFFLIFFSLSVFAQLKSGDEVQATSNGEFFLIYTIKKGETIYSLSKEHNVSQQTLLAKNPHIADGLKAGMKIDVPVEIANDMLHRSFQNKVSCDAVFIAHETEKSETVYSLSKKFNVPINEFLKYNPQTESGIKEGEWVLIPTTEVKTQETQSSKHKSIPTQKYTVVAGDTFYSISKRYDIAVDHLIELNEHLNSESQLKAGTQINVPLTATPDNSIQNSLPQTVTLPTGFESYVVKKGDTFSSIKRDFGISKKDLIKANPQLKDEGLKSGVSIFVPVDDENVPQGSYLVKKGDTMFGIARSLGLSESELVEANPSLKERGLEEKMILKIPEKKSTAKVETSSDNGGKSKHKTTVEDKKKEESQTAAHHPDSAVVYHHNTNDVHRHSDTFKVALLMPFYANKYVTEMNVRDSVVTDGESAAHSSHSKRHAIDNSMKPSLNFYEGLMLGLDSMYNRGLNPEIKVYDTESMSIEQILSDKWLTSCNLIVGPRSTKMQTAVSLYSAKHGIPMVAPFLSLDSLARSNKFYFEHSPSKAYLMQRTADFVVNNYVGKNIVAVNVSNQTSVSETAIVERIKEHLKTTRHYDEGGSFSEVSFTGGGDKGYTQIRQALQKDIKNVVLVPLSDNMREREANFSRVINALQVLSKNYDITLIGMSDYSRLESINIEYFHRLDLHLLTSNHVDYGRDVVKDFVGKYRNNFNGEPDAYSFRGYDIALFFGDAYSKFGRGFVDKIDGTDANLLQDRFVYRKIDSGNSGHKSQALFIVNYNREWKVETVGAYVNGNFLMNKNFDKTGF